MTISKRSGRSSARSAKSLDRTARGRRLERAAREALAHARGRLKLSESIVRVPETIDIVALRAKLGLSQAGFADAFGLDVAAVRDWEQARRQPDRAARILLAVIATDPSAVRRVLASG